ncbi:MAG TPA: hypothetical protein VKU40_15700, partial [Thermoanaerobaculia bacterium]|nr:hypothetical protein [Thermoanaerobaculia bacterium]
MPNPNPPLTACRLLALLAVFLALPLLACQGCATGAPGDPPPADSAPADTVADSVDEPAADGALVAVRLLGDSAELRTDLDRIAGDVGRWAEGRRLVVIGEGDELPADAEAEVIVTLLPLAAPGLTRGLPVDLSGPVPVLAGERYESVETAVSLRLPDGGEAGGGEAGTGTPRWLVAGRDPRSVARLAGETVFSSFGFDVDGWEESTDYMVRQASFRRRAGSWLDGRAVDARDDFTADAEWFAGLEPYAHGNVVVLAPPGAAAGDMQQLGASLSATINRAAPLLPLAPGAPPVRVAVEHDYPAMIRHTGDVGLAVPGGPADLHLVVDG